MPTFDPSVGSIEAKEWSAEVDALAFKHKWDDVETIARCLPFLSGSARELYNEWTPIKRTWPALKEDLQMTFPKCRDLCRDFKKAATMTSEQYSTVSIYAAKKHRVLKQLRLQFRETEMLELTTGGITDPHARSIASSTETASGLFEKLSRYIPILPNYSKSSSSVDNNDTDRDSFPSLSKKPRLIFEQKRYHRCNRKGHLQRDCCTKVHNLPKNIPAITMGKITHQQIGCIQNKTNVHSVSRLDTWQRTVGQSRELTKDKNGLAKI